MNAKTITAILVGGALLLSARTAAADDTSAGLGVAYSATSPMVQGDLEFDRRVGFQAALGPFAGDHVNGSLGGRFYFVTDRVAPYLGGLFVSRSHDHHHTVYEHDHEERLFGPTVGVRFRKRDGLGAFVQLEVLQHVGDGDGHHDHDGRHGNDFHAFLGAGVQWWF